MIFSYAYFFITQNHSAGWDIVAIILEGFLMQEISIEILEILVFDILSQINQIKTEIWWLGNRTANNIAKIALVCLNV